MKAKSSEDALTIRDVVSQAKDAELKSQAKGPLSEKADSQNDLPKDLDMGFFFFFLYIFVMAFCPRIMYHLSVE